MPLLSRMLRAPGRGPTRPAARRFRPCLPTLEVRTSLTTPASLGAAGSFGVLEINGGSLSLNNAHLAGNVGQGPGSTSVLENTDVSGTFTYDPTATLDLSNVGTDFAVAGGILSQSLAQ